MGVRIFWAIIIGFLAGVCMRSFFYVGSNFVLAVGTFSIIALFISFFNRRHARYLIIIAFVLISGGLGIMRMAKGEIQADPVLTAQLGTRVTLVGVVSDEPDVREKNILVPITISGILSDGFSTSVQGKILAQVPAYTQVSYGDSVRVVGTLRSPEPFDTGLGRQFDYPKYLAVSGISYQLTNAHIEIVGANEGNSVKAAAIGLKHIFIRGLAASLPEPESGLAGGITVGDKRSLGPELSDSFRRVSLVHIIVLSGYNITVVLTAIAAVITWLPRTFTMGISGFVVLFFVLMTGGAASAVRAGAMALLAMYARVSGRTFLAIRALGAVAFLMVMWNPYTLGFDPSFQLSVLASLGLITFTPIFSRHLWWVSERFGLREIAAATLGTQCAVLPLLLFQNGQLSLVSLPANLLALIPIPFAMLLSFIAAISGILFGSFAVILGFPAFLLLSYVIGVATIFSSFPFATIAVPAFSVIWMLIVYALMLGGVIYFSNKKTTELGAQPLSHRRN